MRATCEAWSQEANPSKAMSGFAQTTHILNQRLAEEEVEIDNSVDPDYVPKRAGFVKETNSIDVVVPSNGAIAAAEARLAAAEMAFNNVSRWLTADPHRSPLTAHHSPLITRRSPLAAHHPSTTLNTYRPSRTTHHPPHTTHHSPPNPHLLTSLGLAKRLKRKLT